AINHPPPFTSNSCQSKIAGKQVSGEGAHMRTLLLLIACATLAGCQAVNERVQGSLDIFKTRAQLEAEDTAACQHLGAQPGTDIYVQCMIGRAQIRAT